MDHHLDLLLQLFVDLRHGYNVYHEGQIEVHSREDDDSVSTAPLEPLVLEGLPDELGPEWRDLHPFEIPGVRIPTEDTPPNHRRLAESDALVEVIQTAEYLEDAPSWGQRRFYLP